MNNLFGRRAVVIGSGIGGLSAAAVLASYFEQVEILERDQITAFVESRPGTPQDRHPHGLLAGGLKSLDEILPGFEQELAAAGAVPVKIAEEFRLECADIGALPSRDFGLSILCASRPLIESVLRRRVMAIGNVSLRSQCRVVEILADTSVVRGVRFDTGFTRSDTLESDLVVDASGRGALTLSLLDALGWERPEFTEVTLEIGYSTTIVRFAPHDLPQWKLVLTEPDPPNSALKAVFVPLEGDRWYITIADRRAVPRLETWDDFLSTFSQLEMPTLSQVFRHARPIESVRHFGFSANRWQHFERLHHLPHGVLPIADALCRFNPTHGQGMSSAAMQSRLLRAAFESAASEASPIAAAQAAFMSDVKSVIQQPWNMSTSVDLAFPEAHGERPENFEDSLRFQARLLRAAVADPIVHRALIEVGQLLQPHTLLHEPHIRERIEAGSATTIALSGS
ncbi:FAD-dependent oxidoreductase [Bradyrhizobium sp. AZCC 2230]|uniref:FAD-dependent oxidoreductase n=1 Tax=Bradyrhizobium sp. AZCC 2230 TaxID=3117021 RepID=UPI002FF3CF9C